jgi:PKD repeat protein
MVKKSVLSIFLIKLLFFQSFPQEITEIYPKDGQLINELTVSFNWNLGPEAQSYNFVLSSNELLADIVFEENTSENNLNFILPEHGIYYWKVDALNQENEIISTGLFSFHSFNPSLISGLLLWLDPGQNISVNNGKINEWVAVNNSSLVFLQDNPNKQPELFPETSINNMPVVSFDGIDDNLLGALNYNGIELTTFLVQRVNLYGVNRSGISLFNTEIPGEFTTNQTISLSFQDGAGLQIIRGSRRPKYYFPPTSNWVNENFSLLSSLTSGTNITTFTNNSLIENLTTSGNFDFNRVTLGSRGNGETGNNYGFMNTDFAEIILYSRVLSDLEQALIHSYFQSKYSPIVNLGADILNESSLCPVTLDAGERFTNYLWSTGETTQTIEVHEPGTYSVTVTDIFGFESTDQIQVNFPKTSLNVTSTSLCLGESIEIFPQISNPELYTFQWSTGAESNSIEINEEGNYWVKITDNNDCFMYSDTLTLYVDEFSDIFNLGENTEFCSGNILTPPDTSDIETYLWNTGSTEPFIFIYESGTYSVTVTNSNNCIAEDQIEINVVGIAPDVDFEATTACFGSPSQFINTTTLDGDGEIKTWFWDFGDGQNSVEENPLHLFPDSGIYNVSLTAIATGECENTFTSTVEVLDTPIASFQTNLSCINQPALFFDTSFSSPDNPIVDWFWVLDEGISSTESNPNHLYQEPGIYEVSLTVTSANLCHSTTTAFIEVVSSFPDPLGFTTILPKANDVFPEGNITFQTNATKNASFYILEIAEDQNFNYILTSTEISPEELKDISLSAGDYFYRVKAFNICLDSIVTSHIPFKVFGDSLTDNIILWLKASNVNVEENRVTHWPDTVNEIVLLQALTSTQPLLIQEAPEINNNPFIRFDGNNDNLVGSINYADEGLTSFILQRVNSYSVNTSGISLFNTEIPGEFTTNQTISLSFQDGTGLQIIRGTRRPKYVTPPTSNWVNEKFSLLTANVSSSDIKTYKNNLLIESFETSENFDFNQITLGSRGSGSNGTNYGYMNTDLAEIIIFGKSLDIDDQNLVIGYFQQKYSPRINLGLDRNITYGFCPVTLDAGERFESYLWNTGEITQTIEVLEPGTYSVTVTDIFGFQSTDSVEVKFPAYGLNVEEVTVCLGTEVELSWGITAETQRARSSRSTTTSPWPPSKGELGSQELRSSDPARAGFRASPSTSDSGHRTSDYTFLWNTGDTTATISVNETGTYTLLVMDTIGCAREFTALVFVDDFEVSATLGEPRPFCMGDTLFVESVWDPAQLNHVWNDGSTTPGLLINEPGEYSVTVTNPNGCVAQSSTTLDFQGNAPEVDFVSTIPCFGEASLFTGTSSAEGSEIVSRLWYFADPGNEDATDSGEEVSYTYSQPGIFNATLAVESAAGCSRSKTLPVQVYHLPEGWFTPDNACTNVPVLFNDASADAEGGIDQWQWSFYDVDGNLTGQSTEESPEFTFDTPGKAWVELLVTSVVGCRDTVMREINIKESPSVDFSFTTPCLGEPVFFTDLTEAPPWALVTSQEWDFGDGQTSPQSNPSHLYQESGMFDVTLSVTAMNGCAPSLIRQVTVHSPPETQFATPALCVNTMHTFMDETTVENSEITHWQWDFDGQGTSTEQFPEFSFGEPGQYMVSLTTTSAAGCGNSITLPVDVFPAPEPAFSYFPRFGVAPLTVSFSNQTEGAGLYFWDFGDGSNPSEDANPIHTYMENGVYVTQLTAFTDLGCAATEAQEIKVIPLYIDVAVSNLTYSVKDDLLQVSATLTNLGTLEFDTLYLEYHLSGNNPIRETWTGELLPGQNTSYTFSAQLPWRDNYTHFCVEASIPGLPKDDEPGNNRDCFSFKDEFRLLPAFPNPAEGYVNIGFILPYSERVTITLNDIRGHTLTTLFDGNAQQGVTTLRIPIEQFNNGIYFYRVTFREESKVGRFMKY